MDTTPFEHLQPPYRRADDDHVADEHGWETWLNNGALSRYFPVEFATGIAIDEPTLRCQFCHRELRDVRGRVRKTHAAAVVQAAALCPDCNDVTACDARILPDGTVQHLHGDERIAYATAVRAVASPPNIALIEADLDESVGLDAPRESSIAAPSALRRLVRWIRRPLDDWV